MLLTQSTLAGLPLVCQLASGLLFGFGLAVQVAVVPRSMVAVVFREGIQPSLQCTTSSVSLSPGSQNHEAHTPNNRHRFELAPTGRCQLDRLARQFASARLR